MVSLCVLICDTFVFTRACSILLGYTAMTQPDAENFQAEMVRAAQHMATQRTVTASQVYQSQQELWFQQRHKRGPPSTPLTSQAQTPKEDVDTEMAPPDQDAAPSSLFQPHPLATEAAWQVTAAQAGIDMNDNAAMAAYMATPLTTRGEVLQTIRDYHTAVI